MTSTLHEIFIRKILHLNQEDLLQFVEDRASFGIFLNDFIDLAEANDEGALVILKRENLHFLNSESFGKGAVILTVEDCLEKLMTGEGQLTEERFQDFFGPLLKTLFQRHPRVRVYSEMKDHLWDNGHTLATMKVEDFWKKISLTPGFLLISTYSVKNIQSNMSGVIFHCINDNASMFISKDTLNKIHDEDFSLSLFTLPKLADSRIRPEVPSILDVLSAEICHEARNPLTIIKTSAEIIKQLHEEGMLSREALEERIKLIEDSVVRINSLLTLFGKTK